MLENFVPHGRGAQLGHLFNRLGLIGFGVEIGVCYGEHADSILSAWKGDCLFLVDPWREQTVQEYSDFLAYSPPDTIVRQKFYENCLSQTKERMRGHPGRSAIVRDFSVPASGKFPDQFFAWVYIDANHAVEHVDADIKAWWPKVKMGGILCGHDYDGPWGVKTAVDRFAASGKLRLFITGDGENWLIQKPLTVKSL